MAKPFDASTKELFHRYPRDWLALIGWPSPSADGQMTIVDSDLATVSRTADKLLRVDGVGTPYIAHFEFQSNRDAGLDWRMLQYNVLARIQHERPVRSVAILFKPEAGIGVTGRFSEQFDADSWLEFGYRRINLWELPTDALLKGPLGTLPLAPLTVSESRARSVVQRIGKRLKTELPIEQMADVLEYTRRLLGVRFGELQKELIMPTSLNKLIEENSWTYKQTVEKGRMAGLAEGLAEGRHEQLIEQGTDKFGPPDAATVARVQAVTDIDELRRMGRRLLRVDRWDDLFADAG